jgi:hypothetical protein
MIKIKNETNCSDLRQIMLLFRHELKRLKTAKVEHIHLTLTELVVYGENRILARFNV